MTRSQGLPRSSRSDVPSPRVLGLRRERAVEDLEMLGWTGPEHTSLLWTLAAAGSSDLALNNFVRLVDALRAAEEDGGLPAPGAAHPESMAATAAAQAGADAGQQGSSTPQQDAAQADGSQVDPAVAVPVGQVAQFMDAKAETLLAAVEENPNFRRRLFALLGASTALGDHVVANPGTWVDLAAPMPSRQEMMDAMLAAVGATPVEGAGELTFKAAITGSEADSALMVAYRNLLARVAAIDLASTMVERGHTPPKPLGFEALSLALTDAADAGLTAALAVACSMVYGKPGAESGKQPARLAVLAMGKCGAQELNYISDVDVIFVAEPADARAMRWAGEFINIGSRVFFEVDAALRPEGKRGALVRTLDSHVNYYRRWAKTWEFQALLKARPMSGDLELGRDYCEAISPMVWSAAEREDFVPDVQAMRRRVIENVPADLRERELKLGEGGLRDVEFAVQLLQLVHGRTDENLRVPATVSALRQLVDGGYVGREDGQVLIRCYEFMRLLEHRLQLHRLKRTHTLPEEDDIQERRWLAKTSGRVRSRDSSGAQRSLVEQLELDVRQSALQIQNLHRKLFYRPLLSSVVGMDADAVRLSPEAAKRQLAALGYESPQRAFEHLRALADGTTRKHKLQAIILPSLLEWLSATVDPDAGLLAYRKLSEAAMDRSWFLRLLRDENIVGKRLMFLLGTSPFLADLLLNSIDSVKLLSDGAKGPKLLDQEPAVVTHSLVAAASRQRAPDKAIGVARALRRAELSRIAAADLLGLMSVEEVCESLSWVWDAVLEAALQTEIRAWEDEHQTNAPATISVIGMGRLGGAELGYGSDADVMFVAEPVGSVASVAQEGDGAEAAVGGKDDVDVEKTGVDNSGAETQGSGADAVDSDATGSDVAGNGATDSGAEAVDPLKWAITICESVRRRLGKPSQDPPLEVDSNLRPEGRNGALVRTLASYERYYSEWGETWELQALLRATWIAGDKNLGMRFLRMIDQFRYPAGGATAKQVSEVRRMKARVDSERLPKGADKNLHTKLGRGGLTDVEWTAQLLTMQHCDKEHLRNTSTLGVLKEMAAEELISEADALTMREAWITATKARNALALVRGKRKDQLPASGKPLAQVAAAAGWPIEESQEFLDDYLKKTRRARTVVDRVFWGEDIVEDAEGSEFDHMDQLDWGADHHPEDSRAFGIGDHVELDKVLNADMLDRDWAADRRDEVVRAFRGRRPRL
ncbi:bifunctional [glutamine synthetase] adenylyltransferase/[glutamine synthetase]-adenylyl-L-tyrosine phosphorylase [Corynebacterium urealyticum]|uniref:bifunctional [glutamine synthetase] adenylyltransferase/[glutamine synthetase]-adenylyl-L-tyrosine phosphorylase n=1 Tax=Corynebacterium urealyticum TaxID=43771 RepID=UPI0002B3F627|nr:bifunctional [glutamine synthetase] adenylyltransferase/[glutamine synthetase]-adenylyl-L-tyrosine phosphorylase [Corynebacterium urealyticum]AGE36864.1 glutamate-ammonia-ligase adenylyltransferase [Corynebacterium urealyticum DSM 7111]QQB08480.1 bifunctional [glutamine synthetase] adenylyltransferase/[glutamine synthetase]-adenylyl-L-tyrosine phosphorylase [Corynebacterium urealyticum]